MTKKKVFIAGAAMTASAVLILAAVQRLLQPKYMSDVVEGNLVADYYNTNYAHDVLFVGDCECYENFSPVTLWEEYGIPSYIRGSAQQLIWQSYYLLEDALRYETPKVVIFNVLSMKYGKPQNEAYNRMSIEGMRWSSSKVNNIKASMTEDESFLSYVFPILRYHSRWSEISTDDFKYYFGVKPNFFGGYYLRADVKPAENVPVGRPLVDYQFADTCWEYLDKMRTLCQESGIQLLLIKAPSLNPYWYDEWEQQITDYSEKYQIPYLNFLKEPILSETGVDFYHDTYDAGLHMNVYGAEKLSRWLGQYLVDHYGLMNRSNEPAMLDEWGELCHRYHAEYDRQTANLEQFGNVHGKPESPDAEPARTVTSSAAESADNTGKDDTQ